MEETTLFLIISLAVGIVAIVVASFTARNAVQNMVQAYMPAANKDRALSRSSNLVAILSVIFSVVGFLIAISTPEFRSILSLSRSTPTPTRPVVNNGFIEINAPKSGVTLSGTVLFTGTATINNFAYSRFEIRDAGCADSTCFLFTSYKPTVNDVLFSWDTRAIPNGEYEIQFQVVSQNGLVISDFTHVKVKN